MEKHIEVIGIDHGWSNMKTATQIFTTGVKEITTEPAFYDDVVELDGKYYNEPTTFEFTKEDIASGAELSGAMLTVIDKDGSVVDRWTSVAEEAHVIKRLAAGETYTLREEFAPYGYLKAEEIQFTVEDTADIQRVVMKDEVPTGAIIINKDGEFVTDTTLMKGHWYDFIFNYFKDSLAGVEFEVYAAEDIVSPDGLDTIYYEADELVATIVTDEKGYAGIDSLPLGKYYLVETKTLEGFVLDDTPIEADLSYIDQETAVVYAGMNISNERQKVQITVVKKEAGTKEVLEGAVFGLFAKEDIVNKDGKVVVKAGKGTGQGRYSPSRTACVKSTGFPRLKYQRTGRRNLKIIRNGTIFGMADLCGRT